MSSKCTAASNMLSLVPPERVLVGPGQDRPSHAVPGLAQRLWILGHLNHRLPQLHHSVLRLEEADKRPLITQSEGAIKSLKRLLSSCKFYEWLFLAHMWTVRGRRTHHLQVRKVFWDFHSSGYKVHIMGWKQEKSWKWDCFATKLPSDPDQNRLKSAQV